MDVFARSTVVESMWDRWAMIETLRNGTDAMRAAREVYLPRWPMEDDDSYTYRVNTSFLFNGLEQTVESLSGRPFAEPVKINDDVPATIKQNLDDVDLEGRNLHAFARDIFRAGVALGHSYILVDFPTTTGANTQADLQATKARPYMQHIFPQQLLSWSAERINGVMTLTRVCIWELLESQEGLFASMPIFRVRVIMQDRFEVWEPIDSSVGETTKNQWQIIEEGPNTLGVIPLVPFYALRTGYMRSRPPLLDLAFLNIEHWQSASDQRSILHTARVPLLAITGLDENSQAVTIGAKSGLQLPVGADAKWVETEGHAIAAGRQDLLDIEERMRQLGAELVVKNTGKTSATQAAIVDTKSESKLGAMAQNLQDAINMALWLWARWIGESAGGTVEVYQDFGIDEVVGTSEATLLQSAQAGKISDRLYFSELQRRGTLSSDADFEKDQAEIEAQGPELGSLVPPPENAA